ncbi:Uncharacterised protein [Staphylococcus aureus]|nr:hypothetical protein [Staphylococcus aureus]SCT42311.1 Uncharacterised protein [Staphylococcus aureus]
MALGILSKLAMAGIVLTSVTGAATLGGVSSIAHEDMQRKTLIKNTLRKL